MAVEIRTLVPQELADRLPKLYETENQEDPLVHARYYFPDFHWKGWFPFEFDGVDLMFGLVIGDCMELGYWSLDELRVEVGPRGYPIQLDPHFIPIPLSRVKQLYGE